VLASRTMPPRAALFDLDRTLVRVNTTSQYVRFQREAGLATWRDSLKMTIWLARYTVGLIDAQAIAEKALAQFEGQTEAQMIDDCERCYLKYVREHVSASGRNAVEKHRAAGDFVAIVTGTTPYAAGPVARELGIEHMVCSELEVTAGAFTGKVRKPLAYGPGKVVLTERLAERLGFLLEDATFYTDSITDLPLMERVRQPVAINPDPRLRRIAKSRGWPIEIW
jgi:HAD superfamily hydrolase (TIGR01490 family)